MAIHVEHDLHRRRLGRNVGLGLVLAVFVGIVFGLTIVKVSGGGIAAAPHVADGAGG
jgi:hypothetical protein